MTALTPEARAKLVSALSARKLSYWQFSGAHEERNDPVCSATADILTADGETIARLTAERDAAEARVKVLETAAKALQADMLERAHLRMDVINGEQYRVVNAGNTAWAEFCDALKGAKP